MRKEVRFSGFGGQGIVLAGVILGKAAALYDNKLVVHTQSYGPQARGGACKSDVIIGDDEIRYPKVKNADILIAFSQIAYEKFKKKIHERGGAILIDSELIKVSDDDMTYFKHNKISLYKVNAIETADGLGNKIAANMVMLGALSALTDMVSKDALKKSVKSSVPESKRDMNRKAIAAGYQIGTKLKK